MAAIPVCNTSKNEGNRPMAREPTSVAAMSVFAVLLKTLLHKG